MKNKYTLLISSVPAALFLISIIIFTINTRIAEGKPVIDQLNPNVVSAGDLIEINGKNFGRSRESSRVFIASIDLLSKNIISWSDSTIKIMVPEQANSGLVFVETDRGMSEPVVVVLNENVPFIGTGAYLPGLPFIETIDPYTGGTGAIVSITGDNFGINQNNSRLLFSSELSRERDTVNGDVILENFLEIQEENIISWKNKEISFYLPEFIKTGDVYIQTESGYSNAVYFDQLNPGNNIDLVNKQTYMFNQSVTLEPEGEWEKGNINVWFASPVSTVYQRNVVNLLNSFEQSPRPCRDVNLYKLSISKEDVPLHISQNTIVEVFEQNYSLDVASLNNTYDKKSPLYMRYTASTDLMPTTVRRISSVATSVTRRKSTNYDKANAIYDYVIARLAYSNDIEEMAPDLVIDSQLGDSKAYSLLFCALARSVGIPARPVAGILADNQKNTKSHWWAEFFIQDFGWFPVDPALADGMIWDNLKENPVEYYWGNIDNQHIAFSRGEKSVPRLFPDGIVYSDIDYAFFTQNIETDRGVMNLHSKWSDIVMSAIY